MNPDRDGARSRYHGVMPATVFEKTAIGAAGLLVGATLIGFVVAPSGAQFGGADGQPLTYAIAGIDPRSGQAGDGELAVWALEAWAAHANGSLQLQATAEKDAVVRVFWAPPGDSTFGEMRPLTVDGRPGAAVYVRADMDALGLEIALRARRDPLWRDTIVYLTCLHELGHALGLSHTADARDIMYFFGYGGDIVDYFARYRTQLKARADIRSVSGLSAADISRLRALHPVR